jgi:cytosine/adenosine deaminase-related metal-dependent hydrolase
MTGREDMSTREAQSAEQFADPIVLRNARCVLTSERLENASVEIADGRITRIETGRILNGAHASRLVAHRSMQVDLTGYCLLPGLINAHDHLEYALYPRLGDPPYANYVEWGEDIHRNSLDVIAKHRTVPRDVRLWWGGIRNLLCGVTTVAHHNPLWPALEQDGFPVRVVRRYGWAHSLALGGDLQSARANTPKGRPFIVHAGEGLDEQTRGELWQLDRLGLLDEFAVLVHGLAIDRKGVALMNARGVSLVACPSSNHALFATLPDLTLLGNVRRIALGSDSPLTAAGNLLDEIRFAISRCRIPPSAAWRMVTTGSADILRLTLGEGSIVPSGVADLLAIRDTGANPTNFSDRLASFSSGDVELVMIGGCVQLASEAMLHRLPRSLVEGLEPLSLGSQLRWVRAPIQELLQSAETILGDGEVRLGGQPVRASARVASAPAFEEAQHAC